MGNTKLSVVKFHRLNKSLGQRDRIQDSGTSARPSCEHSFLSRVHSIKRTEALNNVNKAFDLLFTSSRMPSRVCVDSDATVRLCVRRLNFLLFLLLFSLEREALSCSDQTAKGNPQIPAACRLTLCLCSLTLCPLRQNMFESRASQQLIVFTVKQCDSEVDSLFIRESVSPRKRGKITEFFFTIFCSEPSVF